MKKTKLNNSYKIIIIMFSLIILLVAGSVISMLILLKNVKTVRGMANDSFTQHYAFIHKGEDSEFWKSVYNGAVMQGESMGIYVQDFDENLTVDYSQKELMRIAIDSKVDGLIIEGENDSDTLALIEEATEAGIPVVTVLNDVADSSRICFVSISSYAMGRQYGEQIIPHVPESHTKDINVDIFMNTSYANSGQSLVVSGIYDVFKENGLGDQLQIEVNYVDSSTAFSAEEEIRDVILNGRLPDAVIGLDSVYTRCLYQAVVDYNKVGDVFIYGFGDSEEILEAVNKNIVEATISANTYDMGGSAVSALDEYIKTGYVSEYLSQDTELIKAEQAGLLLEKYEENAE